ncbi:hypothetical protein SAMN05421805_13016 [Saccharopolyspora antimicrobica]|uniref:Uncharacterized protein n=1 Tax=Saccharopolyspora antimicrobica TaxID=455193 RepID=A0A1I5LB25_9PSEU|nr:hypothetical protein [Saccharopolyspora antimicrobica]RKT85432.1 hypothetical protein ATL45_3776 [Saccharopolyspora antimicrobica]SFO94569.1 hypothetical protein SAMN05421805_13016 [Saccharopolyspora antimicrobica]
MDPRLRADEALARARARGAFVVTPDNAISPMDAANTVRIPRDVVDQADSPDTTQVIPSGQRQPQPAQQYQQTDQHPQPQYQQTDPQQGWPTEDYGQGLPPNPYHAQRGPNEFGPLGSQANQQQYPQY